VQKNLENNSATGVLELLLLLLLVLLLVLMLQLLVLLCESCCEGGTEHLKQLLAVGALQRAHQLLLLQPSLLLLLHCWQLH
jgi:hypothetical protein